MGFDDNEGIALLIYGRSGTGKTTLWGTFPGKILAVICSGGSHPGELRSLDTPKNRKRIDTVEIESTAELAEVVEYQKTEGKYDTLVIDHVTGLQDLCLKEVVGLDKVPEQLSWGLASQQQYGQVALQMKERLRSILDLTCNRVIVSHEREFNTDGDSSEFIKPFVGSALTPSVCGWLNGACDYICQTFIRQKSEEKKMTVGGRESKRVVKGDGVEYCLRTGPHEVYATKFRVPKGSVELPDVVVDPDYDKIMKLIRGN